MIRLTSAAPCFPVGDVGGTMRWYEQKLGFKGHPFPENEPHAFCNLVRDQIEIMFSSLRSWVSIKPGVERSVTPGQGHVTKTSP